MRHLTCKPVRTTGPNARDYVRNGVPFTNSNGQLFGRWETPTMFVVYSYGDHWPLFIWHNHIWYANEDKASRTTSKHYGQAHPLAGNIQSRSCTWMKGFVKTERDRARTNNIAERRIVQ